MRGGQNVLFTGLLRASACQSFIFQQVLEQFTQKIKEIQSLCLQPHADRKSD